MCKRPAGVLQVATARLHLHVMATTGSAVSLCGERAAEAGVGMRVERVCVILKGVGGVRPAPSHHTPALWPHLRVSLNLFVPDSFLLDRHLHRPLHPSCPTGHTPTNISSLCVPAPRPLNTEGHPYCNCREGSIGV